MFKKLLGVLLGSALLLSTSVANADVNLVDNGLFRIDVIEDDVIDHLKYEGEMYPLGIAFLYKAIKDTGIETVYWNSPGGRADTYPASYLLFSKYPNLKFGIKSGDICLSACAFVFAKSNDGVIEEGGIIGFHLPYLPQIPANTTLQEYAGMMIEKTMQYTELWIHDGYSLKLISLMAKHTNPGKFMMFRKFSDLQSWRDIGKG